jgi:flagellin-like hook-associated protein FlgL
MSSRSASTALAESFGGNASGNPADAIGQGALDSAQGQLDIASLLSDQATSADSVLDSIANLLDDASMLVIASAGNTLSDADRQANQTQMDSILQTIDRLGSNTNNDSSGWIKLGDLTADDIGTISIGSIDFLLSDLGSGQPLNLLDGNINGAAMSIEQAINDISEMREEIGSATQGSTAEQYIQSFTDAMETSRQLRAQTLAATGSGTTGFGGDYQGGILSLLA